MSKTFHYEKYEPVFGPRKPDSVTPKDSTNEIPESVRRVLREGRNKEKTMIPKAEKDVPVPLNAIIISAWKDGKFKMARKTKLTLKILFFCLLLTCGIGTIACSYHPYESSSERSYGRPSRYHSEDYQAKGAYFDDGIIIGIGLSLISAIFLFFSVKEYSLLLSREAKEELIP